MKMCAIGRNKSVFLSIKNKQTQERLARALTEIGWSQTELARRIGVTQSTTSNMLRGKIAVSSNIVRYVERIAEIVADEEPPRGNLMPSRKHAAGTTSRMRQSLDRLTEHSVGGPVDAE